MYDKSPQENNHLTLSWEIFVTNARKTVIISSFDEVCRIRSLIPKLGPTVPLITNNSTSKINIEKAHNAFSYFVVQESAFKTGFVVLIYATETKPNLV